MKLRIRTIALAIAASGMMTLGGCSTWDRMSSADKGTVGGAVVGGAVGSAVTGGGTLGTIGGAAVGGAVGREAGRR